MAFLVPLKQILKSVLLAQKGFLFMGEREQGGMLRVVVVLGLIAIIALAGISALTVLKTKANSHSEQAASLTTKEMDSESYENSGNPQLPGFRVWGKNTTKGYDYVDYGQYGALTRDQNAVWSKIAHSDNGYAISFWQYWDGSSYQPSSQLTPYQFHIGWSNADRDWKTQAYDDWGNLVSGVHYDRATKRIVKD